MIGLYIYKNGCPYSEKYLGPWKQFSKISGFPCKAIEMGYTYKGTPIIDTINGIKGKHIIDTKPAVLFFDTSKRDIFLDVTRPVTPESLKKTSTYLQTGKEGCKIYNCDILNTPNRKSIVNEYEHKDTNSIFVF